MPSLDLEFIGQLVSAPTAFVWLQCDGNLRSTSIMLRSGKFRTNKCNVSKHGAEKERDNADRKRKETHEESPATCIDIDYIHDITQSQCPSKGCSSIPGHITRTSLQNQAIATVTPIDSHTKYNGVADTTVVFPEAARGDTLCPETKIPEYANMYNLDVVGEYQQLISELKDQVWCLGFHLSYTNHKSKHG
ncbi:uncharacterized protein LOC144438099 [Glandiceps talaboti]